MGDELFSPALERNMDWTVPDETGGPGRANSGVAGSLDCDETFRQFATDFASDDGLGQLTR